jgi:hypothetical protein
MIANDRPKGGKTRLLICVGLALFAGVLLVAWAFWPTGKSVEQWRKEYPFVSLSDRLKYEIKHAQEPPVLTPEAKSQLAMGYGPSPSHVARLWALEQLHSEEAARFIKRQGFGPGRMSHLPSTDFLDLPAAPIFSLENVSYPESMLESDPPAKLPKVGYGLVGPARLLSLESLSRIHVRGLESFLSLDGFGYVKNRDEVSGFEPHQFRYNPAVPILNPKAPTNPPPGTPPHIRNTDQEKERWVLRRLELVSLLKFEKPAVYLSSQLPRMQDLKDTECRDLSAFEEKALKQLQAGEDLATEATSNRILMLGSLRARNQCLECHHAQYGELLGAFSYELLRDPRLTTFP